MTNIIKYGVVVGIIYIVTLLPFIKNTIVNNYSSAYSFYSSGGVLTELLNQVKHLGLLLTLIIIGGLIYGIIYKKYRKVTLLCIVQYIMIIYMFTRIQTMGVHHTLILLPAYIYGLNLFIICLSNNKKTLSTIGTIFLLIILIQNIYYSYTSNKSVLFTDISIKTPVEKNYKGIKQVTNWLEKNIDDKENSAYMIVHNNIFNPDKFRNFYTPNSKVHDYLPYGSAIVGVHKFPIELFESKYIITTNPYIPTSVDEKYNDVEVINITDELR